MVVYYVTQRDDTLSQTKRERSLSEDTELGSRILNPTLSDTKVHSPPGFGGRTRGKMSGNKLAMKKENAQPSRKEQ